MNSVKLPSMKFSSTTINNWIQNSNFASVAGLIFVKESSTIQRDDEIDSQTTLKNSIMENIITTAGSSVVASAAVLTTAGATVLILGHTEYLTSTIKYHYLLSSLLSLLFYFSNMVKTTLLTNVFNEEYLLPFWLLHHKDMFDELIVIDYRSTDKSMDLCRNMWPDCKIFTTRNAFFDAEEIDKEFMDFENGIEGIKIVLNTTEFLVCDKPIVEIFESHSAGPVSFAVNALSPYSQKHYNIHNTHDLFKNLFNDDVVFHEDRGVRQIHTFSNGNYTVGRHTTLNPFIRSEDMHIVWLGYFPMNKQLIGRKLQIQQNIPERDKVRGYGFQHLFTRDTIFAKNYEFASDGRALCDICPHLHDVLTNKYTNKTFVVTGGCGFIGSHMVDKLVALGHEVIVIDILLSGNIDNLNPKAVLETVDIRDFELLHKTLSKYDRIDGIFHFAAIARTPWCIDDPLLCYQTNVMGTMHVLEAARLLNVPRVVLSSSNVVYAFLTPYRTSKEALEGLASTYVNMYNMSVISLRYSNVYGKRQSETGPSPNVFAALRKSRNKLGKLVITGDGEQTRNYTHVSDIVTGNLLSMFSTYSGVLDLCTGVSVPLNEAASYFECPIEYTAERPGDVKHIIQSPEEAFHLLGWKALVQLKEGIKDVL